MFELKSVNRRRHHNVVQLLGFCVESSERLLAYEYLSNGNLYDWLHPNGDHKPNNIEWPLRVKIGIGLARALVWLHHKLGIVHLDISSKCILLDQNFKPKLSNFGQAMHLKRNGRNSPRTFCENIDFWQMRLVKEDVYSFGLVVLELITDMEPSEIEKSLNLNNFLADNIDNEIFQFLEVACHCVQCCPNQRPTMLQVYKKLSAVGERYGVIDTSEAMLTMRD